MEWLRNLPLASQRFRSRFPSLDAFFTGLYKYSFYCVYILQAVSLWPGRKNRPKIPIAFWFMLVTFPYGPVPRLLNLGNLALRRARPIKRRWTRKLRHYAAWTNPANHPAHKTQFLPPSSSRLRRLDSSNHEIRLLYFARGGSSEDVILRTRTAYLDESPRYTALSYAWGNTATDHAIKIDDLDVPVSSSLFEALSVMYNTSTLDTNLSLWIDALSINQYDLVERSDQVAMMKDIYGQASKIWVWLSPPSESTELALAKLMATQAFLYREFSVRATPTSSDPDRDKTESPSKGTLTLFNLFPGSNNSLSSEDIYRKDEEWNAVNAILQSPWWTRAWMAQEVSSPASQPALNGNVELILGRQLQTVSFGSAIALIPFMVRVFSIVFVLEKQTESDDASLQLSRKMARTVINIGRLEAIRKLRKQQSVTQQVLNFFTSPLELQQTLFRKKVWPMLRLVRPMEASEPRDKVYASVQMVLPYNHPAMKPDYSLPLYEVFGSVVADFIKYEGTLAILSSCTTPNTDLPSFAPDWRTPSRTNELGFFFNKSNEIIYQASEKRTTNAFVTRESVTMVAHHDPNSAIVRDIPANQQIRLLLTASGLLADTVSTVSPKWANPRSFRRDAWEEILSVLPDYYAPTDETLTCAYQRLLKGDISGTEQSKTSQVQVLWRRRVGSVLHIIEVLIAKWLEASRTHEPIYSVVREVGELQGDSQTVHFRGAHVDPTLNIRIPWIAKRGVSDDSSTSLVGRENQSANDDQSNDAILLENVEISDAVLGLEEGKNRDISEELFRESISTVTLNRVLYVTERGYIGLGPEGIAAGDCIVVLDGGPMPFVLRLAEGGEPESTMPRPPQEWRLVGETYVHGLMDGEAAGMNLERRDFVII